VTASTILIAEKAEQVKSICATHHVKKLILFGSALTDRFKPESSDLDLLVEFLPLTSKEHARHYFLLMEELEAAYGIRPPG
jgi:uncharacterized protein